MAVIWHSLSQSIKPSARVQKLEVMTKRERLVFAGLVLLALFFLVRYFAWWIQPIHLPNNWLDTSAWQFFDLVIFITLSFVVFLGSFLRLGTWFAAWFMKTPQFMKAPQGLKVAFVTCFVPGSEPLDMLERTLVAMKNVRYPHDTWVLDEGHSDEVKALAARLGVNYFTRNGYLRFNKDEAPYKRKTKGGNLNSWRFVVENKYDVVAQTDVDHAPKAHFFERTLGYFRDPQVGFVGVPQIYKNVHNWIARGAAEQTYSFYGSAQKGYFGNDMPFLIGTAHIYRTAAMYHIGGYNPTIAEDHITGMAFYDKKWKGVYVPEVLTKGEGPTNWIDYLNQQMRWSYGLFEILFKYSWKYLRGMTLIQKINYLFAQQFYFTGVTMLLGMILTFSYLAFGLYPANISVYEWVWYSIPPFIMGYVIDLFLHRYTINPDKEPLIGLRGMFLAQAANVIYAYAFFQVLLGRKLTYVVTQKGAAARKQKVSLKVFTYHLGLSAFMTLALVSSYFTGHDSWILRFWAIHMIVSMFAVSTSLYWISLFNTIRSFDLTTRIRASLALARLPIFER